MYGTFSEGKINANNGLFCGAYMGMNMSQFRCRARRLKDAVLRMICLL